MRFRTHRPRAFADLRILEDRLAVTRGEPPR